jgi:hypothetical protein
MKLSALINRLQQFQTEHGDVDFCVVATGRSNEDGKVCTVIGNDLTSIDFEDDSDGRWGYLMTETEP